MARAPMNDVRLGACQMPACVQAVSTLKVQKWFWNRVQLLLQRGMAGSSGSSTREMYLVAPLRRPRAAFRHGLVESALTARWGRRCIVKRCGRIVLVFVEATLSQRANSEWCW